MDEVTKEERATSSTWSKSSCDVLIVGAGLAGLALALQLSEDDVRVILVDKNRQAQQGEKEGSSSSKRGGGVLLSPANVLWARKVRRKPLQVTSLNHTIRARCI